MPPPSSATNADKITFHCFLCPTYPFVNCWRSACSGLFQVLEHCAWDLSARAVESSPIPCPSTFLVLRSLLMLMSLRACDLGGSRWGAGTPPFGSHRYKDLGNSMRKGCTPALRPGCWPSMNLWQAFSSLEVVVGMLCTSLSHSWAQGGTILVPLRMRNPLRTWEPSSFPASGWWRGDIHFSEQYSLSDSARCNLDCVAWISPLKLQ